MRASSTATTSAASAGSRSAARSAAPRSNGSGASSRLAVEPAEGLIALPYLQGERTPVWDEAARGCFFGLDLAQGRGHLYRAMLEGVALGFRHCMAVAEEGGVRFAEVVASDGAARSPLLRQTLADALGVPVTWSSEGGGTLEGTAILAGLAAGVLADPRPRDGSWRPRTGVRHEPDARAHARLQAVFARRVALFEAVRAAS
jgi:xylulokinase